jgi:hypothetical protein
MLALLPLLGPAISTCAEIPAEFAEAVARAERLGKALAEAVPSARRATKEALASAKKQGAELCDFDYLQVPVSDGDKSLSYLIATTKHKTDILVGRHFLLSETGPQPSTKTCFNMGTPKAPKSGGAPAMVGVSHLLSPAPNEYHVYLSLIQPVPLVVITSAATWSVSHGKITLESESQSSASAPARDLPQPIQSEQMMAFEKAIAPYVSQARETYPAARDRYLAGLPAGEKFFVTTRLHDKGGKFEQVFIRVTKIEAGTISGQIASKLDFVTEYKTGQSYSFPEAQLLDWVIVNAQGREEGNVVGKFLDTYRP